MRVLCWSPYNKWRLHGQWEMTILQALKRRGADVTYVMCDGVFSDCDMFWAAKDPRPENACEVCQQSVIELAIGLDMDWDWVSKYLADEELETARAWARELPVEELDTAAFGTFAVADWVRSSVHSHLRRSQLDVAEPEVERAWRSYLSGGLIACFAVERMLDTADPEVVLLFNGRMSSTRVAFELSRRRGIRTITHERGLLSGAIQLYANDRIGSLAPMRDAWAAWQDVPLSGAELEDIETFLADRANDRHAQISFTTGVQPVFDVRAALDLDDTKPTWVLFTSSDDEVAAEPDFRGPFATQLEWIERTVAHVGEHPELQLVVRVHPNTGSRRSFGTNARQLAQFEDLARRLPANVRMVAADEEISSYGLMDLSAVGLVYSSTAGLEMACRGKPVVVAGGTVLRGTNVVHTVEDPDAYEDQLRALHATPSGASDAEIRRLAHRLAYTLFFRTGIPFPLVAPRDAYHADVLWIEPHELDPGRDAGLDRCVGVILDGDAPLPGPTAGERARDDAAEQAFLRRGARSVAVLAHVHELVADGALLAAWNRELAAGDDVTLVIHTPPEWTERLLAAVAQAGLDRPDAPDLVAVDGEPIAIDAVLSRHAAMAGRPRFDDASLARLHELLPARLAA